jgi:hypothetical protein
MIDPSFIIDKQTAHVLLFSVQMSQIINNQPEKFAGIRKLRESTLFFTPVFSFLIGLLW